MAGASWSHSVCKQRPGIAPQAEHEPEKTMSERVKLDIEDHVATVTLARPEKRNAVDLEMFTAIKEAGRTIRDDQTVRAVVLTGAGDHFCAGIDISIFQGTGIGTVGGDKMQPCEDSPANFFQSASYVWREVPVPVIAALRGSVFGAGLQIAMGADIRFVAASAALSIMEIKWGLVPDMALSTTLRGSVSRARIFELACSGRIVNGPEAAEIGLATAVKDDPLKSAHDLAADIARKSPDAIRANKRLMYEAWEADHASALRLEAELQSAVMAGANQAEAVLANMEKREPKFDDPTP